jgi:O-antigen ligase
VDAVSEQTSPGQQGGPNFRSWMGSMWLYTVLRFALFFALWGILLLAGLGGLVAAAVALFLSIPLSFVLLAVPRQRFAAQIEARVDAHREQRQRLDADLDPEPHDD